MSTAVRAVVFDIGETILDRTREYAAWAEFFGVPAHTFSAVFGAMIARGAKVAEVVESFAPGTAYADLLAGRAAAGLVPDIEERDLYPDVRATFGQLHELGLTVGVVGNQPARVSEQLRALELGPDFLASSTDWAVSKPSSAFFERVCSAAGAAPEQIIYVGDQLHNDVIAPLEAGLLSMRVIRGPWGYLTRDTAVEARCLAVIGSLLEIPALLRKGAHRVRA